MVSDLLWLFVRISELFKREGDMPVSLSRYHKLILQSRDDGPRGGAGLFIIKDNINVNIREDTHILTRHIFDSSFIDILNQTGRIRSFHSLTDLILNLEMTFIYFIPHYI